MLVHLLILTKRITVPGNEILTPQTTYLYVDFSNFLTNEIARSQTSYFLARAYNRPFPSYLVPVFQNEALCKTFHMETSLICAKINL